MAVILCIWHPPVFFKPIPSALFRHILICIQTCTAVNGVSGVGMLFIQFITLDNPRPTVTQIAPCGASLQGSVVRASTLARSSRAVQLAFLLSLIKEMQAQLAQQLKRVAVRKMPFIEFSGGCLSFCVFGIPPFFFKPIPSALLSHIFLCIQTCTAVNGVSVVWECYSYNL